MNTREELSSLRSAGTKVLVIDDDERLNALLTKYLGRFGFSVRTAVHPKAGLRALRADPPDVLVLGVMLPDMDGFAVCRTVRETSGIPIVMLTARGEVADRIVGLELGADDYLPKPFEPRELVARIQAVLRRQDRVDPRGTTRIGALTVSWAARSVRMEGRDVPLTTAQFALLGWLIRNRGRVQSRDKILDQTRGIDWEAYDRSVDVLVSRLRQKLGDHPKRPRLIRTVRGAGYLFIGGQDD